MRIHPLFRCLVLAGLVGCQSGPRVVLHDDLGSHHRTITTRSDPAQRWFDQGLIFIFAFNHGEAIRSFDEALKHDPGCAMAYWGKALAAGPHINNPTMDEAAVKQATAAVKQALALAASCSPVERDLIEALGRRYADPPPTDRRELDVAYSVAMREVWKKHPGDPDVGTLFAESLMDLRPWDLWTPEGTPQPGTEEILSTLEAVLLRQPGHPGANHYTVHSLEASPYPEKALPSADRLRNLVPGAAHLVHMPAHIDQRLGHYADSIAANQKGIDADRKHAANTDRGGMYALYRAHNFHFLAWSAMFDGQSALALQAARDLVREVPPEVAAGLPDLLDGFIATPFHVMVRFGLWADILAEPEIDLASKLPLSTALRHHARAMAYSATGRLEDCEAELKSFERVALLVPASASMGNNTASAVLDVARALLEGELLYRRNKLDNAFARLREGVQRDDALRYDEPWAWMQPVRHALGALLVEAGKLQEAEAVYKADLRRHPENGWSLHGLAECQRRRGDNAAAVETDGRFKKAWARADVTLRGSCYCRTS